VRPTAGTGATRGRAPDHTNDHTKAALGSVFERIGRHLMNGGRIPAPEVNVELVAAMSCALLAIRATGVIPRQGIEDIRGIDLARAGDESHEGRTLDRVLGSVFTQSAAALGSEHRAFVCHKRAQKTPRSSPSERRRRLAQRRATSFLLDLVL
jgi:hypothetical protein